jgi:predicted enzyme related to lactoylglutathione lyase
MAQMKNRNKNMNFKLLKFSTIRISSSDVSRSSDWYQQLFEIKPIEELSNFVSFNISDVCLDIALADPLSPSSVGGAVGYWQVDNLDQVISRAIALGGEIYRGPLRVEEIQRTIVQIKDPVGNVIGFEANF